jgi:translation initiation factor 1
VRVGRQTKGRKGKGVTVVTGVPLGQAELEEVRLRRHRA